MTRLQGPARRLTVIVGESDRFHHHALSAEIVHRAHRAGLAGATTVRGDSGFGASRTLHTSHVLSLSDDLPVLIYIVDSAERIEAFLPELDGLITEGLVIVEDVEVIRYTGRPGAGPV